MDYLATHTRREGGNAAARIVLLGPPGSGKGTQAASLDGIIGACHVSTGDVVRTVIASGSPLGQRLQQYSDRGELVPDQLIVDLVLPYLSAPQGWVLDGFPRDVVQARALAAALASLHLEIDRVLALQIPDQVLIERLEQRRLSTATGKTYNLTLDPPPDDDPGPFIQRADDHPAEIQRRLQIYHAQTEPLLAYYQQQQLLTIIDARGSIADVHQQLLRALGRLPATQDSVRVVDAP